MNDDERVAWTAWTAWTPGNAVNKSDVDAVVERHRAASERERRMRRGALVAQVLLLPVLVWCAARGITPVVRGAYALMAVGSAFVAAAEWVYLDWSRQALPGPVDTRSQLQKSAFMLARQTRLMRTAMLWSAPIFAGIALVGVWLYQERTHVEAMLIWSVTAAGWLTLAVRTVMVSRRLHAQKTALEHALEELT